VGGKIGPDLNGIRAKYGHADIIESVLYPSKRILDGYQQVFFEVKGEEGVSGIVRTENAEQVNVIDSSGTTRVLEKTNIISRKTSPISLMPEGMQTGLSVSEFADLIAYVEYPDVPLQAAVYSPLPRPRPAARLPAPPPGPVETPSTDDNDNPPLPPGFPGLPGFPALPP
jgi:putative heme-binding domain-containing protein